MQVLVPPGCLADLSGPWVHADDPTWRYDGVDDGGTLTLLVTRTEALVDAGFRPRRFRAEQDAGLDAGLSHRADAGAPAPRDAGPDAGLSSVRDGGPDAGALEPDAGPPPDAGSHSLVRVVLQRTSAGFLGNTIAPLAHPSGRLCEVRFRTEVVSCEDAGLTLSTESAAPLGDECQLPARPQPVPVLRHLLIRPP
jgi:hypothetical protein